MSSSIHPLDPNPHPVLDTIEKTRSDHHEEPLSQTTRRSSINSLNRRGSDIVDQVIQQSESVPIPSEPIPPRSPHLQRDIPTWQSLASKSSNQLPSTVGSNNNQQHQSHHSHESEHDKHSVLPDILPGFKDRMADIHHATYKSISNDGNNGNHRNNHNNHNNNGNNNGNGNGNGGDIKDKRLAKSSILYESADPSRPPPTRLTQSEANSAAAQANQSKTLIQGGQGERRWSHEISPEKAGLVGAVLETAGLLKDVVLDKIQQRPPTSGKTKSAVPLSSDEKLEATKIAFGGSEEMGDQTLYLEGYQDHMRREQADRAAAEAATTSTTTAKGILNTAPQATKEHQKSIFHVAANPEVKKSMLLDHPEALGYHARDPNLAPLEENSHFAPQGRLDNSVGQRDITKTTR